MSDELEDNDIGVVLLGQRLETEELVDQGERLKSAAQKARTWTEEDEAAESFVASLPTRVSPTSEVTDEDADELLRSLGFQEQPMDDDLPVIVTGTSAEVLNWSEMVRRHREALEGRGIETETLGLDAAMTDLERAEFERDWEQLNVRLEEEQQLRQFDQLMSSLKTSVLHSIVRPFGLGAFLAVRDRVGGPLTTVQGMKDAQPGGKYEGLPASEFAASAQVEQGREPYNPSDYHGNSAFRHGKLRMQQNGAADVDAYTGRELDPASRELDHVIPASEIHRDPALNLYLNKQEKVALANSKENLAYTERSVNRSKRASTMQEFVDERGEQLGVDPERAKAVDGKARRNVNDTKQERALKYYAGGMLKTTAANAAKLGLREGMGLLLAELLAALFDEAVDIFKNGVSANTGSSELLPSLRIRMERVAARVVAQKDAAWSAMKSGALAGAISSIVTVAINTVVTTARRGVRIIREGLLSLVRAVKMLVLPPPGLSPAAAAHEASKIVASAVILGLGVAAQEPLEKAVMTIPLLLPFATPLIEVMTGIVVGVASGLVVYMLDRLDIFGVKSKDNEQDILERLQAYVDDELKELDCRLHAVAV